LWVRHFETVEELRLALLDFAAWDNTHWLVARHGHQTPAQIRADQQPAMDQAADKEAPLFCSRGGTIRNISAERSKPWCQAIPKEWPSGSAPRTPA
jgi:hypothetical protein